MIKFNAHIVYIFVIVALITTIWLGTRYTMGKITGYQTTIASLKAKNVRLKGERDECKNYAQSLRNQQTMSYGTCNEAMQSLMTIPALALPPALNISVEALSPPESTTIPITTGKSDDAAYTTFINTF